MKNHIGLLLLFVIPGMLLILGTRSDAPTGFETAGDQVRPEHVISISQELNSLGEAIIDQIELDSLLENSLTPRPRTSVRVQVYDNFVSTIGNRSLETHVYRSMGSSHRSIYRPEIPLYLANMALLI